MGIHDRDYARTGGGVGGGYGGGGMGGFRMGGGWNNKSANTWLIIINVAVFVIGALLLGNKTVDVPTQRWATVVDGVSQDDLRDALVDRSQLRQYRDASGRWYEGWALLDPQSKQLIGYREVIRRPVLDALGHFSTGKGFIELEVWRLVTFQFLHAGMGHLLMNMLGLYFFGPVVESRLGSRRVFLAFYLVCGIFGALFYLLLNLLGNVVPANLHLPGLLFQDIYTPLVGASAGVFGVLIAAAYLSKDAVILLFFVIPMKIRNAAFLLIGLETFHLLTGASNAGGNAAHLGGAAAGWFFIRRTHLLTDFFDVLAPPKNKSTVPRGTFPRAEKWGARKKTRAKVRRSSSQREVDRVLDKVRDQGMHALTEREKEILRKATDEQRGG